MNGVENALIVANQTFVMFLMMGVGYILFKWKKISIEGSKSMANMLIYVIIPCVIVNSFLVDFSAEKAKLLVISAGVAAILLAISMIVSHLVFHKTPIDDFSSAFSNPGFFGLPLIQATLGNEAVFFVVFFIAFLNVLQWTYGVARITETKVKISFKGLITTPAVVALLVGLAFFFLPISMPQVIGKTLSGIASINAPLAMLVMGVYLAQADMKSLFITPRLYGVSAVRLLLIPVVSMLLLSFLPSEYTDMKLALLITSACPVGANVAAYAQIHDKDYPYAVKTVVLSSLFSIISMPLLMMAASWLW